MFIDDSMPTSFEGNTSFDAVDLARQHDRKVGQYSEVSVDCRCVFGVNDLKGTVAPLAR